MPEDVLDNAVWHALTGPRRSLGTVGRLAGSFDRKVSVFGALCDEPGQDAWAELASILGAGRSTTLFRPSLRVPREWDVLMRVPCVQMVATPTFEGADERVLELVAGDVPEMEALVEGTRPGPFGPRTIEFGGYVGIRSEGRLVAMAGERFRCPGWTEISGVCTDESHRGKGLATVMMRVLVHRIRERGEEAFLHAASTNVTAIRLYEKLGFVVRREVEAITVRAPGG